MLRVNEIRIGDFYVCDDTHDKILETIFQGNNFNILN